MAFCDRGGGYQPVYAGAFGAGYGFARYGACRRALVVFTFGIACNLCGRALGSVFDRADDVSVWGGCAFAQRAARYQT